MTDLPQLKMKALVNFPAQAYGNVGITVNPTAGAYYINLDYSKFSVLPTPPDLTPYCTLLWNSLTNSYQLLAQSAAPVNRVVTAAGTVTVASNDRVVAINKATGSATPVSLPLAANKSGPVVIADIKRDAATNNITITPTSPETIQGQATATINTNGGSIELFPIAGVGYATVV